MTSRQEMFRDFADRPKKPAAPGFSMMDNLEPAPPTMMDLLGRSAPVTPTTTMVEETSFHPTSRAKHRATAASPTAIAEAVPTEALAPPADEEKDRLSNKQKDFAADQRKQLADALATKDLSSEEKVAMALLSILPGLIGGIGGGIAAGGAGAAAGVAGGLQGSAQGLQMMAGAKTEARKEALGKAQDLQNRMDKIDEQLATHEEKVAQRGEHQKDLDWQSAKEKDRDKLQRDLARMHEAGEDRRAGIAAGAKGGGKPPDDTDVSFYNNTGAAMRAIDSINTMAKGGGANLSAWITDPEKRALLQQSVAELAHAYTKIGDPNSAVLIAELRNTVSSMLENPDTTRTKLFLTKVNAMAPKIAGRARDYNKVRPNVPVHPLIQQLGETNAAAPQRSLLEFMGF